jgi:hypothetical protein
MMVTAYSICFSIVHCFEKLLWQSRCLNQDTGVRGPIKIDVWVAIIINQLDGVELTNKRLFPTGFSYFSHGTTNR